MSSGRSVSVKDSRSALGCGGVTEVIIVHPERATGSWRVRTGDCDIFLLLLTFCNR